MNLLSRIFGQRRDPSMQLLDERFSSVRTTFGSWALWQKPDRRWSA